MQNVQENCVELNDVTYSIGGKQILKQLNMRVATGKLTVVLGPSGSGKSSLLKVIGTQVDTREARVSGEIRVLGRDVNGLSRSSLRELRKQMGMLFQNDALFSDLSVYDNVAFPLREHSDLAESMLRDIVLLKLNAVGLRAARQLYPAQLSAGMSRRVALARAMALDPSIILYDEPFNAQDPISTAILRKLISQLSANLHVSGLLISHDVGMALDIADYVYLLHEGRIIEQGTPHQIQCSASAWVQQFVHGSLRGPVPFHYPGPSLRSDLLEQSADSKLDGSVLRVPEKLASCLCRVDADAASLDTLRYEVAPEMSKRESA